MRAWRVVLPVVVACAAACQKPPGPCFAPSDQTAGWKQVQLPDEAPGLAAPADIDQFRAGEAGIVWEPSSKAFAGAEHPHHGLVEYRFSLPPLYVWIVEIGFSQPLDGVKVDGDGLRDGRRFTLFTGRLFSGKTLMMEIDESSAQSLVIGLHKKPDKAPVVKTWRLRRQVRVSGSQQPAVLWETEANAFEGESQVSKELVEYRFRLPSLDPQVLDVEFAQPLDSAKVDAVAFRDGNRFPIFEERRVKDNRLRVEWQEPNLSALVLSVHKHFRETPTVKSWHLGRRGTISSEPWLPPAFRAARTLYFLHPGGQQVLLCNAPGQPLGVRRESVQGAPASVTLTKR